MSKIEWTDKTWNVITGCTQISPACKNCYAKTMTKRLQGMALKKIKEMQCQLCNNLIIDDDADGVITYACQCVYDYQKIEAPKYYYGWDKVVFHTDMLAHIFNFSKYPSGCKVFVNSMSDTFHNDVSYPHIRMLFNIMRARSDVIFQVLTKRHMRMYSFLIEFPELLTHNIWLGVTAENQEMVNERVHWLVNTKKEIKRLKNKDITIFVSCEPLLESIDLSKYIKDLDWVIVGGERANKKGRVVEFEWVKNLYSQCKESKMPFFFKQWGDCEKAVKDYLVSDDLALAKEIENTKEFTNQKE